MAKAESQNFHQTEAVLNPLNRTPDISDDIQQTLARLLGFSDTDNVWKFIRVDQLGRIVVATTTENASNVNIFNGTTLTVPTIVLTRNIARQVFEIHNASVQDTLFICFSPTAAVPNVIYLSPAMTYHCNFYSGDVYLFSAVAGQSYVVREWS